MLNKYQNVKELFFKTKGVSIRPFLCRDRRYGTFHIYCKEERIEVKYKYKKDR